MKRTKLIKNEISRLFNTTKATIRHYEDKEIIYPEEDENGYKLYNWKDIERLNIVIFLKNLGVKLRDIKGYIDNKNDVFELLQSKSKHIDDEINRLISMKNRIDNILETNTESMKLNIVRVKHIEERRYHILEGLNDNNIKYFYDSVGDLYNRIGSFNEVLILFHQNYKENSTSFEESCILLPYSDSIKDEIAKEKVIPKGDYIAITYVYNNISDFNAIYNQVIEYADREGLDIDKTSFLEIEHKDYNILYKEKLYELQFRILV